MSPPPLRFDLFCHVVDNYGDVGVCWRLAADLGARGHEVRLWIDDATALGWMAPDGAPGVAVHAWADAERAGPADVVVEAFGCDPPAAFVERMAARVPAPRWINLEYLSAEDWAEHCHGLPSPQLAGPGKGLVKRFFYPGFTPSTGGLLRERDLLVRQAAFDREAWLAALGVSPRAGERIVGLFCYPVAPLPLLWRALAGTPSLVLLTPGAAQALAAADPPPAGVRTAALPWLAQRDYDHLLWSCDVNLVRGEDSAVRAMWAGRPFVWQLYAQHDGVHAAKLAAFVARFEAATGWPLPAPLRAFWQAWNGVTAHDEAARAAAWPDHGAWALACRAWREHLLAQTDLATQLLADVGARAAAP
ncbi:MAG: elongation factor P maturation arginine rhamnosyltransferase EarP [Burkholderiaceae bacterium]|jgi:uncharacterized repeat protein (TIGR03837 family)|nr:elongation factor P maturation arginine rhamnosyltransferase EarP [Burkholderiaceae bacterium]